MINWILIGIINLQGGKRDKHFFNSFTNYIESTIFLDDDNWRDTPTILNNRNLKAFSKNISLFYSVHPKAPKVGKDLKV